MFLAGERLMGLGQASITKVEIYCFERIEEEEENLSMGE